MGRDSTQRRDLRLDTKHAFMFQHIARPSLLRKTHGADFGQADARIDAAVGQPLWQATSLRSGRKFRLAVERSEYGCAKGHFQSKYIAWSCVRVEEVAQKNDTPSS